MAEVLYGHWRSHSYELARQPEFKDAAPNLRATFEAQEAALLAAGATMPQPVKYQGCRAGRDGDCFWIECPQLRDNEPRATGRHCPRDTQGDDFYV